ncbi:type II toxin-antitoxin system antitoxin SocA domain-containing protein [Nitrospirillum amazonense]|uniref:Panacea domain-containing protein n=1 Tax=Nitrospirillum amazonense TaxID=28077 RepID=UPI002DD44E85|nr:type II toxin-antitoxin system antitoxin SocA domain-containing protein [Nitrospirillum amazonense]MEC4591949.1 type II toxin-antitoxin system antitoxin SocA domain-containing protein [Nitrospirillum amazonense]
MAYDGRALANLVLDRVEQRGQSLTHMALHKVLYYAHGWHLADQGEPLVSGGFEAWKYGPVIRPVYNSFKNIGDNKIKGRATAIDLNTGEIFEPRCELTNNQSNLLSAVLGAYGHLHAYDLSRMTHQQDSPWDRVWNGGDRISLGMRIPDDAIREHFVLIRHNTRN